MSNPTWLPLAEAARRIGVSADTVRRWVRSGRLKGKRLPDESGRLFIDAAGLGLVADSPPPTRAARKPRVSREQREARERLRKRGVIQ